VIKLYRRVGPTEIHYHEAWVDGDVILEHWGAVGNRGASRQHPIDPTVDEAGNLDRVLAPARSKGFASVPLEDHSVLLVEYTIEGMGTAADVEKRYRLQDRLDNLLGWVGAGHCDGGSIGSGTMEACCYVVDFVLARDVIADDLAGTEFANYSRLYEEGQGEV
jgi:hypothetical protein